MHRIEEKLHHEVLPINVNATPKVGETRSKVIKMMGLRKIKAEHKQQTYDQVEGAGNTQVKQLHP